MKRTIVFALATCFIFACNDNAAVKESTETNDTATAAVQMPYTPAYSATFTDDVSDQDLLTVLNSYKYWENGDMKALDATIGDSIDFQAHNGWNYNGPKAALLERWAKSRDSLSSVVLTVDAWRKSHEPQKKHDWVAVWYKEVVTFKDGRVDSAYYQDDNLVQNGKIVFYSQHKRVLKPAQP